MVSSAAASPSASARVGTITLNVISATKPSGGRLASTVKTTDVRAGSYPAGTFLYEVGNTPHVTAVDPAGPCTVYVTQNGPLDFNMIDQPDPGWR